MAQFNIMINDTANLKSSGEVIAAVSLAGPIQRMNEKYFPSYKSKVIQAANNNFYFFLYKLLFRL
ncbi:IclR family transcriptional regulator domain-containing protein [Aneurinibacillus tyrosinisolvens]|uniref:IclR family transcriptional regulator domain-containing protein n=1 Tax=Aneurinibacillus tyrosinisolvens TaxID=1443435 RepID=UPI00063F1FDE|nr:IclR family transcriptional regulator C-terminal domain-containing protein [Aneurinibacillus tyrosinisolvens]